VIRTAVVLILLSVSQVVSAAGAGVLVFCQLDGETSILIADHKKLSQSSRGWSSLGGTIQPNESELDAAVREVYEESHGVISRKELYQSIDPEIKVITPGFVVYFAQIPCYSTEKFNRASIEYAEQGAAERGPYQWLPWADIKKAASQFNLRKKTTQRIKLPRKYRIEQAQTDWFFAAFLSTMVEVKKLKNLPMDAE
jgi:8-oxo-dGTP pyrophosphatase MutT (NUDIX family)